MDMRILKCEETMAQNAYLEWFCICKYIIIYIPKSWPLDICIRTGCGQLEMEDYTWSCVLDMTVQRNFLLCIDPRTLNFAKLGFQQLEVSKINKRYKSLQWHQRTTFLYAFTQALL